MMRRGALGIRLRRLPQTRLPKLGRVSFSTFTRLRAQAPKDPNQEEVDKQLKKLQELRDRYNNANLFEAIRLKTEMLQQLIIVQQAQARQKYLSKDNVPTLNVTDVKNPAAVNRQQVVFQYMLQSFIDQCKVHEAYPDAQLNPDTIADEICKQFSDIHTDMDPLTLQEVLHFFAVYWALANNVVFMDELKFDLDVVQNLLKQYASVSPYDDATCAQVAEATGVGADVVLAWFQVFDVLAQTPFSDTEHQYTCQLCPVEYSQFKAVNDQFAALQDKVRLMYGQKNNLPKGDSAFFTKDKKRKSGDPKVYEFEVGPQQFLQIGLLVGFTLFLIGLFSNQENPDEISFQEFVSKFLKTQMVDKLYVVNGKLVHVELNDRGDHLYHGRHYFFNIGSVEQFERALQEAQRELNVDELLQVPVLYHQQGNTLKMLINFLPTVLFLGAIYYMTKKASSGAMGGPFNMGKLTAKKFNQETNVKVKFADVAGMSEAKEEVMEFVKFLQNPDKYEKLGAKIPRGAILSGPPGTGKTLLAKATAGEAEVPFYLVLGSEFVEMFVGVGALRVRDLFKTARENAPLIVFIDEIDAIGKQRSKGNALGANDERETTLNQLLVEMDGFELSDHVVVFAGTNRADILDKALMRPGRFDRHVYIDNPELAGRKEIFEVHLKKITLASDIDHDLAGRLAALTPGFSGADIANVCNEAALIAARFNAAEVHLRHFELAIERVIGGVEKKSKVLSPDEKKVVAYHEAGHAVCGWYLEHAHPLLKVSIIPRGLGALGYAQYLPPDQFLYSAAQLVDRMVMTLGGRVLEELHFDFVTLGGHDDFKKVTQIAQLMVMRFGMLEKVGMVNYADTQSQDNLTKPFSDETNEIIDDEIQALVRQCHERCRDLLKEHSDAVELVAQELLSKEFITREDMIRLLGKRPFPETNDAFDKYLDGKDAFRNEKPPNEHKDGEEPALA